MNPTSSLHVDSSRFREIDLGSDVLLRMSIHLPTEKPIRIRSMKDWFVSSIREYLLCLVSNDFDKLLKLVAADKRQELQVFSGEVVRFGNRSIYIEWHNLQRYFDRISKELTPQRQLNEDAVLIVEQLMVLVQYTANYTKNSKYWIDWRKIMSINDEKKRTQLLAVRVMASKS